MPFCSPKVIVNVSFFEGRSAALVAAAPVRPEHVVYSVWTLPGLSSGGRLSRIHGQIVFFFHSGHFLPVLFHSSYDFQRTVEPSLRLFGVGAHEMRSNSGVEKESSCVIRHFKIYIWTSVI